MQVKGGACHCRRLPSRHFISDIMERALFKTTSHESYSFLFLKQIQIKTKQFLKSLANKKQLDSLKSLELQSG